MLARLVSALSLLLVTGCAGCNDEPGEADDLGTPPWDGCAPTFSDGGWSCPVTPAEQAAACASLVSCGVFDAQHSMSACAQSLGLPYNFVGATHDFTQLSELQIRCLAAAGPNCAAVEGCIGCAQPTTSFSCRGAIVDVCVPSGTRLLHSVIDCGSLGAQCHVFASGGYGCLSQISTTGTTCGFTDGGILEDVPSCSGTQLSYCTGDHGFAQEFRFDCARLEQACGLSPTTNRVQCIPTQPGAACQNSDDGCIGATLQFCDAGGLRQLDCIAAGFKACQPGTAAAAAHCGL